MHVCESWSYCVYTAYLLLRAVVTCPALTDPTNGMVSVPNNNFESNATYTCDTGYTLNGDTTRTCGSDGVWSGSDPTCTRKLIHFLIFKSPFLYTVKLLTVVPSLTLGMEWLMHSLPPSWTLLPTTVTMATLWLEIGQGLVKLMELGVGLLQLVLVSYDPMGSCMHAPDTLYSCWLWLPLWPWEWNG